MARQLAPFRPGPEGHSTGTSSSSASMPRQTSGVGCAGPLDPTRPLGQQFEADFAVHLRQKAGGGEASGGTRFPLLLADKRQAKSQSSKFAPPDRSPSHLEEAMSCRPTLRRLRYLVKWGHWQLLVHEVESPLLCGAVLDEVVRAFSPWVQQVFVLQSQRRSASQRCAMVQEVCQHLTPLHQLLQRRAAFDSIMQVAEAVGLASLLCTVEAKHVERYRIVFPTILETISFFEVFSLSPRSMKASAQRRLQLSADAIREVLERPDLVEALAGRAEVSSRFGLQPGGPSHEPLEVPPEGVEAEAGASSGSDGEDDGYCSEDFFSCDEHDGAVQASPGKSKAKSADTCPMQGRLAALPLGTGPHTWRPFEEAKFEVRSASYFRDKRKEPAGRSMFDVLNLDVFRIGPNGLVEHAAVHADLFAQSCRQRGDGRFLLIQNFVLPPFQVVITAGLDPQAPWLANGCDTPQGRAWLRFLSLSQAEQKRALKLIMSVEQGPWLVRRAVPKRPLLVGRQLKMMTHHVPGDHFEMVIDVSSGRTEQLAVGIVMRALRNIQLAMACMIEGRSEDELPEALMLCANMANLNTAKIFCPDESAS